MATEKEKAADIDELSGNFLICRTFNHAWSISHRGRLAESGLWEFILRCRSCRTERTDIVTAKGHLVSRSYAYRAGYQFRKGVHFSRDEFREHLLTEG